MKPLLFTATFLFGLLIYSASNAVPLVCGKFDKMTGFLYQAYQETRTGRGVSTNGKIATVVFVSPKGTFTIMIVTPSKTPVSLLLARTGI